jgi:hypothetical protein
VLTWAVAGALRGALTMAKDINISLYRQERLPPAWSGRAYRATIRFHAVADRSRYDGLLADIARFSSLSRTAIDLFVICN